MRTSVMIVVKYTKLTCDPARSEQKRRPRMLRAETNNLAASLEKEGEDCGGEITR